jgi:hypothetical protein
MRISLKIATTAVAVLCMLAFTSVPALAANTGTISATFNTSNAAPSIVSITPSTTSLICNPDGTTPLTFTVLCRDPNGWQDLNHLVGQLYKSGSIKAGPEFDITAKVESSSKEATFTISMNIPYWWPHDTGSMLCTIYDNAGNSATRSSVVITYLPATGITIDGAGLMDFGSLNYGQTSDPLRTKSFHNSANTPISVAATAPNWVSDDMHATTLTADSIWGGSGSLQQMVMSGGGGVIDPIGTSGVGTLTGGAAGYGAPPAPVVTSWQVVIPAETEGFTLVGNYTTTITLTATATG